MKAVLVASGAGRSTGKGKEIFSTRELTVLRAVLISMAIKTKDVTTIDQLEAATDKFASLGHLIYELQNN
jgi:hypothetical protein